jgi:predicted DsbA family dithiol-disulfide isomerase
VNGPEPIEVYGDVTCPFTYVSLVRLIERRDAAGIPERVHVKGWPLELVNGEPLGAAVVGDEIAALREEVAPDLFQGFDPRTWPRTSLPALALAAAAYDVGAAVGERVSLALRHALFEEGRDISAPEVLSDLADRHGVTLEASDHRAVVAEWHEGQHRGVEGSPYFFAGGEGFFCPALRISHADGRFAVTADGPERERFLAAVLRSAPPS